MMEINTYKDGNLTLAVSVKEREEIEEADREEFIEKNLNLFDMEFVKPEEIAALTSAPIIASGVQRDDEGNLLRLDRVWWFPNYQIEGPWKELWEKGEVVFDKTSEEK